MGTEGASLSRVGNILGSSRAETDEKMLRAAFVKTVDYSALVESTSFNFVVGRRRAGKSALYTKVSEFFRADARTILLAQKPEEHETLALIQALNGLIPTYKSARAVYRVLWRAHLLMGVAASLSQKSGAPRLDALKSIQDYLANHRSITDVRGPGRCVEILRLARGSGENRIEALPGVLANRYQVEALAHWVTNALSELKMRTIVLYDGLDEGWDPSQVSTAVLGGLAAAVADLAERRTGIHGLLFIRDNMFRSLAQFDGDFSRHIEQETLRLQWEESSLLELVATRLRHAFSLNIENNTRIWNRFAQQSLQGMGGFRKCLGYTLYRPRDILVLLNSAFVMASRARRESIIDADIEGSAKRISVERLDDLFKEYDDVFPGLRLCVDLFRDQPAKRTHAEVIAVLDEAVARSDYTELGARDFPILGSGREVFSALFSVGFLGLHDLGTDRFMFCHDGASSDQHISSDQVTVVHPCYWKALEVRASETQESVLIQIPDDYQAPKCGVLKDQRMRSIGKIVTQLSNIEPGKAECREFESWVWRTVKILFSGKLTNAELQPNPDGLQQRDLVATNIATEGLWKRIYDDYKARQVIFEVKNYAELGNDDFRQALSYAVPEYGNFVMIVTRGANVGLSQHDRDWVKELFDKHGKLIVVCPAELLRTCMQKLRRKAVYDYTEDALGKLLDTYVRKYLSLQAPKFRRKGRQKK